MNAMTDMPAPLIFTDAAATKVKSLIEEEGNADLKLRVFVTGGGCSGFQYGFTFDETVNEDDTSMEKNGVTLLIDPMSYQYLVGAEIDYQEGLEGAQFVIKNPGATSTCGRQGEPRMSLFADIKSLEPSQRSAIWASYLGWTLDAFDYFLMTFMFIAIAKEFGTDVKAVTEATFLTLAALEIVLGIDNVIFLSVIVSRIPEKQAHRARQIGLALALIFRIILLSLLVWLIGLTAPVFSFSGYGFSWRDLILIGGGLFLIAKATHEIHGEVEADEAERPPHEAVYGLPRGHFPAAGPHHAVVERDLARRREDQRHRLLGNLLDAIRRVVRDDDPGLRRGVQIDGVHSDSVAGDDPALGHSRHHVRGDGPGVGVEQSVATLRLGQKLLRRFRLECDEISQSL